MPYMRSNLLPLLMAAGLLQIGCCAIVSERQNRLFVKQIMDTIAFILHLKDDKESTIVLGWRVNSGNAQPALKTGFYISNESIVQVMKNLNQYGSNGKLPTLSPKKIAAYKALLEFCVQSWDQSNSSQNYMKTHTSEFEPRGYDRVDTDDLMNTLSILANTIIKSSIWQTSSSIPFYPKQPDKCDYDTNEISCQHVMEEKVMANTAERNCALSCGEQNLCECSDDDQSGCYDGNGYAPDKSTKPQQSSSKTTTSQNAGNHLSGNIGTSHSSGITSGINNREDDDDGNEDYNPRQTDVPHGYCQYSPSSSDKKTAENANRPNVHGHPSNDEDVCPVSSTGMLNNQPLANLGDDREDVEYSGDDSNAMLLDSRGSVSTEPQPSISDAGTHATSEVPFLRISGSYLPGPTASVSTAKPVFQSGVETSTHQQVPNNPSLSGDNKHDTPPDYSMAQRSRRSATLFQDPDPSSSLNNDVCNVPTQINGRDGTEAPLDTGQLSRLHRNQILHHHRVESDANGQSSNLDEPPARRDENNAAGVREIEIGARLPVQTENPSHSGRPNRILYHPAENYGRTILDCRECAASHILQRFSEEICRDCGRFHCLDCVERHNCLRWFYHEMERWNRVFYHPPNNYGRRRWFCFACECVALACFFLRYYCPFCGREFCHECMDGHVCLRRWFQDED